MTKLNYSLLEKLIAESKMDQKDLAEEMGLPEKFFSKLKEDGSNLSVVELCTMVDFFGVGVDELLSFGMDENFASKISKGRKYFSKYYDYEKKILTMPEPDVDAYKSSWVSDISSARAYTGSPEQFYVEQKNEYRRMTEIFASMENVLTSIVCCVGCSLSAKRLLKNDILEYLVYGVRPNSADFSVRKIVVLSNKACINLINELEFKKLL